MRNTLFLIFLAGIAACSQTAGTGGGRAASAGASQAAGAADAQPRMTDHEARCARAANDVAASQPATAALAMGLYAGGGLIGYGHGGVMVAQGMGSAASIAASEARIAEACRG